MKLPKFLRREPRQVLPEDPPRNPAEMQPQARREEQPRYPPWLSCSMLELFGNEYDDCQTWRLMDFAEGDGGRYWFGALDHKLEAESYAKDPKVDRIVTGLKDWLTFQLASSKEFRTFITAREYDKRDYERLWPAAAGAILQAHCTARRRASQA